VAIRQERPIPLDVRFTCRPGDVLAIFGPSGSGKTTLLRAVAGLYKPANARVVCNGVVWSDTDTGQHVPTNRRRLGFVVQDNALFPHLTVRDNVAAAAGDRPARDRRAIVDRCLAAVHLAGLEARKPDALSGGERQRVALARALARDPEVLLLDEPFAAVDARLRRSLQDEVDGLRARLGIPVLLVTHDFSDVARLATHVLLIERGRGIASGAIDSLTSRVDLASEWGGVDAGSVFDAGVASVDSSRALARLTFAGGVLIVPSRGLAPGGQVRVRVPAREVILATSRPHGLSLHNVLEGTVTGMTTGEDHGLVQVAVGQVQILADVTRDAVAQLAIRERQPVYVLVKSVSIETYGPDQDRRRDDAARGSAVDVGN
jgi:molybdate transport system ATP-binding protein